MKTRKIVVARVEDLSNDEMKEITLNDNNKILLCKSENEYFAMGTTCTHYGAPLATGVLKNGHVICPWHHAVFNIRSGDVEQPPALDAQPHYPVHIENGNVIVELPEEMTDRRIHGMSRHNASQDNRTYVILGAGAAGESAAETLRKEGYEGKIIMITRENRVPYDRPNLSKEYLSGDAPDEWMPLRDEQFFNDYDIELLQGKSVTGLDTEKKHLIFDDGSTQSYDVLLIATGGQARKLTISGTDLKNIYTLRTFDDADEIIKASENAKKAVIVGSSFIGLETAASLKKREIEVTVVAPESVPFEKIFGKEIGKWIQETHESSGLQFKLGTDVKAFNGNGKVESVELADGTTLQADLVIVGIGVKPVTNFLSQKILNEDGSVSVNEFLEIEEDVYAAGDIAKFPDWRSGQSVRIEHWRLAQQQGRIAAHNMLGHKVPFKSIPFFWTSQDDVNMQYIGYAPDWDEIHIDGSVKNGDFIAYFIKKNKILAAATQGRELELAAIQELMQFENMPDGDIVKNGKFLAFDTLQKI